MFNTYLQQDHHPHCFRIVTTIALHKPAKPDYKELKVWCLITLLNTLRKALEAIVTWRICYIAEHYNLLSQTQYRYCRQHNTTTALELLMEQVHTVWGQDCDKMATLLSLDIAAVFPNISHQQLLHILW